MFENCKIAQTGSIPVHASNFFALAKLFHTSCL